MKTIIAFSALVAVTLAASVPSVPHHENNKVIRILRLESEVGTDGNYKSSFETENGIRQEEVGTVKNAGSEHAAEEVVGRVEYQSPEGYPIVLEYLANEFGFQPKGNHLPVAPIDTNTPPPIPLAIQRSLEYNAAHPEENDYSEDKDQHHQQQPGRFH